MNKPDKLYKYCDQGGLNILETNEIKVSHFFDFNDPFEMKPRFAPDDVREYLENGLEMESIGYSRNMETIPGSEFHKFIKNKPKNMPSYIKKTQDSFANRANQETFVLCLSSNEDNKLMWAHYASGHKGFVIEFDKNHKFFRERVAQIGRYSRPVSYEQRTASSIKNLRDNKEIETLIQNTFFTKDKVWEYEQEWRMIFFRKKFIRKGIINKKRCFLLRLPPDSIIGIILGYKAWERENGQESFADKLIHTIHKINRGKPQQSHIQIKKVVLDESEHKLNIINYLNE